MKKGCLWLFGVAGFLFIGMMLLGVTINKVCVPGNKDYENGTGICDGNSKLNKQTEAEDKKKEAENKEKDNDKTTYGAIHYICEETIKSRLREPSSFEEIDKTFYGSSAGSKKMGVIIKYRARNGFGGMNVASAGCLTDTGKTEDIKLTGNIEN